MASDAGQPSQDTLGYQPALDGLRAISVLAVMGYHCSLGPKFNPGGFIGVDLFFVLSGFLITTLLMEERRGTNRINLRGFYLRRALRLLPALWLLIAVIWAGLLLRGSHFQTSVPEMTVVTLSILFYVNNWVGLSMHWPAILGQLWSLAVEEQFYLVWPPLLYWLLRRGCRRRTLAGVLGTAIAAVLLWRAWLWHAEHSFARCYYATDTRADAILVGCLFGLLRPGEWPRWLQAVPASVGLAGVALFCTLGISGDHLFNGGFTALAFVAGLFILSLVGKTNGILVTPTLRWIGRISYGLYLWHMPIFYLVDRSRLASPGVLVAVGVVATFGCATASFYLVEQPMLRWKRRLTARAIAGGVVSGGQPQDGVGRRTVDLR